MHSYKVLFVPEGSMVACRNAWKPATYSADHRHSRQVPRVFESRENAHERECFAFCFATLCREWTTRGHRIVDSTGQLLS